MTTHTETQQADLLWGAQTIARFLGLTKRQVYYALESGSLPIRKIGGRLCARRSSLLAFIEGDFTKPEQSYV